MDLLQAREVKVMSSKKPDTGSFDRQPTIDEDLLWALLDNPYESAVLIDRDGIVRFMSSYNTKEMGYLIDPPQALGRHVTEVIKNAKLHLVLESGKAEIGRVFRAGGRQRIVARIPLKDAGGRVIGAVGKMMFHQPEKISELVNKLELLESQVKYYKTEVASLTEGRSAWERIVGESEPLRQAKQMALKVAATDSAVLITGESGTGKELFANAIHFNSQRSDGPYIRVNCAAIPRELLESELFGYEAGAFTGARRRGRAGKFELAQNGTILLDEIGDMPMEMQAKLLRVLQEHEIERVGGGRSIKLDFRVIALTNQNLESLVKKNQFRSDLFYRLHVLHIQTPSLRDMREDIPRLCYFFLSRLRSQRPGRSPGRISQEAMAILKQYHWPGNVRELSNTIAKAVNNAEGPSVTVEDLPHRIVSLFTEGEGPPGKAGLLANVLADAEKRAIVAALRSAGGNKAQAARILGIHRTGLYQKVKRHSITI